MKVKGLFLGAVAGSMLLTSCTGPFQLTQKLHTWQTGFDDRWIDELAFLGCVLLPVYGISAFADAIVFNSIEFWTNENPIASTETMTKDGQTAQLAYQADGKVRVETESGQVFFLEKTGDTVVTTDVEGNMVASQTF
ncbi:MAG: DUF3332 family protein [Lentisphaeria bacterium]|nr:DUF3332 family protein [Lentisphaeria bacterium]